MRIKLYSITIELSKTFSNEYILLKGMYSLPLGSPHETREDSEAAGRDGFGTGMPLVTVSCIIQYRP